MKSFEEFVQLWKSETKDIKIKNPDLLFRVLLYVYNEILRYLPFVWNLLIIHSCRIYSTKKDDYLLGCINPLHGIPRYQNVVILAKRAK